MAIPLPSLEAGFMTRMPLKWIVHRGVEPSLAGCERMGAKRIASMMRSAASRRADPDDSSRPEDRHPRGTLRTRVEAPCAEQEEDSG